MHCSISTIPAFLRCVITASVLLAVARADAAEQPDLSVLRAYERNGTLDLKQLEADYRRQRAGSVAVSKPQPLKGVAHPGAGMLPTASAPAAKPPPAPNEAGAEVKRSTAFIVRQDFSDLYLFSNPTPDDEAMGAEFSWARNRVKEDNAWTANGMFAIAHSYLVDDFNSRLIGFSVAPYVQLAREIHSNPNLDDTDAVTIGGSGEIGIRHLFGTGPKFQDYFRARVEVTSDRVTDTRITQVTGEWLPTWLSQAGGIKAMGLVYNFLPEMKVQYASTSDATKPLPFSDRQDAFRIGPEASLLFRIYDPFLPKELQWLQRFSGKVTYHWWHETYSGNHGSWLNAAITYNLDDEGNIGVTASYKKGQNEETGAKTDLFKIALTAKACAELIGDKCAAVQNQKPRQQN